MLRVTKWMALVYYGPHKREPKVHQHRRFRRLTEDSQILPYLPLFQKSTQEDPWLRFTVTEPLRFRTPPKII